MQDILLAKIMEKDEKLFYPYKIEKEIMYYIIKEQVNTKSGFKILKIAVDINDVVCRFKEEPSVNLECEIPLIDDIHLQQKYDLVYNDKYETRVLKVRDDSITIELKNADRYFSDQELKDLGYRGTILYKFDYEKTVNTKDLERELLKYVEKLDSKVIEEIEKMGRSKENLGETDRSYYNYMITRKPRIDMLKQYLTEEVEK